jgi:dsRNA-specific ribonuclease
MTKVDMHALIGDKILGAALLEELVSSGLVANPGEATRQYSNVASNMAFAKFLHEVLPNRCLDSGGKETHSAGTSVEAAVYMVSKLQGGAVGIEQLARWLVYNVVVEGRLQGEILNPKGLLLELGGETTSFQVEGTPPHDPVFEAKAVWPAKHLPGVQQRTTMGSGRSKKDAEATASREMLEMYGDEINSTKPAEPKEKVQEKLDAKMLNAYGHLLTLGGCLEGECVNVAKPGKPPEFVATMRLGADRITASGNTKKNAVRLASQQLLEKIGEYD